MNKKKSFILSLLILSVIFLQYQNILIRSIESGAPNVLYKPVKQNANNVAGINISVSPPSGFSLNENSPIIINLSSLASIMPTGIDPFGQITPSDLTDDAKWDAIYIAYNNTLIPSQVDDIDNQPGYSEADELLFQIPKGLNITDGNNAFFSIFIGTNDADFSPPIFEEISTIYPYPKTNFVMENFPDMLTKDGAFNMDNGIISSTLLVEAAWSSGGFYELGMIKSGWDIVKMGYNQEWEIWKWTRFSMIEQFIETNQFADTNAFIITKTITGPIRTIFQMQSTAPYGKASSGWGTRPGVYGLVTYSMFSNLPWLDYSLDLTGPESDSVSNLIIKYMNRDWGGGRGSTHQSIYVPGQGYLDRNPSDTLEDQVVLKSEFDKPWMIEKIPPGGVYECSGCEGPEGWTYPDDYSKAGFGVMFDDTGFSNITWSKTSESVDYWFQSMEFPFNARYLPFDKDITDNPVSYMSNNYKEWKNSGPVLSYDSSMISILDLPFELTSITKPQIEFDNATKILDIYNVSVLSSTKGTIDDTFDTVPRYIVVEFASKFETAITGDLTYNPSSQTWEALGIDANDLQYDNEAQYMVKILFASVTGDSISPFSEAFPGSPDTTPPIIKTPILSPAGTIRYLDIVNISVSVTDEEGLVESVILSYNNGTWYNVTMKFEFSLYTASIPPYQTPNLDVEYKIIAYDDSGNFNTSAIRSYYIAFEYERGAGIVPLLAMGGILVGLIGIAVYTSGLHKQKYDKID